MTPVFLSLDEVTEIHRDMIERYGGSAGVPPAERLLFSVVIPAKPATRARVGLVLLPFQSTRPRGARPTTALK